MSRRDYVRHYLKGDLAGLKGRVNAFPTVCNSIVRKRDPIVYGQMLPCLKEEDTLAFGGISRWTRIETLLTAAGYRLRSPATCSGFG